MSLSVEFYGVARVRTGVSETTVECGTLAEVLTQLAVRYPQFAETCLRDSELTNGFVANLGGARFISGKSEQLHDGDVLLILSADAGG